MGSHSGRPGGGGTTEGMLAAIPILQQATTDADQWWIADCCWLDKATTGTHPGERSCFPHLSSLVAQLKWPGNLLGDRGFEFLISVKGKMLFYSLQSADRAWSSAVDFSFIIHQFFSYTDFSVNFYCLRFTFFFNFRTGNLASYIPFGARGGAVRAGTVLQARKLWVHFPMGSPRFFHWFNLSGRTMTLGSTQSSTRGISVAGGVKAAGELQIIWTFWEPQPPGTLRACPGLCTDCFISYMPFTHFFVKFTSYFQFRSYISLLPLCLQGFFKSATSAPILSFRYSLFSNLVSLL